MNTPQVSCFTQDGMPVFNITSENEERDAYWWGVNCKTLGYNPDKVIEGSVAFSKNQNAADDFYYGYLYGQESPLFQMLIKPS